MLATITSEQKRTLLIQPDINQTKTEEDKKKFCCVALRTCVCGMQWFENHRDTVLRPPESQPWFYCSVRCCHFWGVESATTRCSTPLSRYASFGTGIVDLCCPPVRSRRGSMMCSWWRCIALLWSDLNQGSWLIFFSHFTSRQSGMVVFLGLKAFQTPKDKVSRTENKIFLFITFHLENDPVLLMYFYVILLSLQCRSAIKWL